MTGAKPTIGEALERLIVQLLGISQRCTDVACPHDLMRLANELIHLVEGSEESDKAKQSH